MGSTDDGRFTTRVGETHPDWSGDPVPKGDVSKVGSPIDSARLWRFIGVHTQTTRFPTMHQEGYNDALGDLAKWLRDAGY